MKLARMLQALRQMVTFRGRASRARQIRMGGFRVKFRRFLAVEGLEHRRVLDSGSLVVTTEVGTGPGSLYSMIELANSQAGPNRIEFAQGVVNVRPGASLPPITDALVVDGGGRVTIDGAGSPGNGLVIKGSDVSIKNISIGGFASGTGILFQGAGKGKVQGVKIGTNLSGSLATPNNYGIEVDGSSNITIGIDGDGQGDVDEANVISGNKREAIVVKGDKSIGTLIAGNFIGTDATGEAAIPNGEGVWISSGSSSTLVRGNTISGNVGSGMNISSAKDSVVEGNIIGLNAKGTAKIANMGNAGVVIYGNAQNTRIGTDGNGVGDVAERNIISGNTQEGIQIEASDNTVVAGNYIGTNFDGSKALPNSSSGIHIWSSPTRARIGTDNSNDPFNVNERNLISGNSSNGITVTQSAKDTTISGNWIGTDATGANAIPNSYDGLWVGGGPISTRIRGNTISGNTGSGIGIANTNGTIVDGNIIGLNANGTAKLANMGNAGVVVYGGAQNTRIGTDGNGVDDLLERNIISGNAQEGIQIEASDSTVVAGNYIGTNLDGSRSLANTYSGILIWSTPTKTRIGTDGSKDSFNENERNLISGNDSNGITVTQSAKDTSIAGNWIGLDAQGSNLLKNSGIGIEISGNANTTIIGTDGNRISDDQERNIISGNSRGIAVSGSGATLTTIAGNWVGLDSTGNIAFGNNNGGGDGIWLINGAKKVLVGTNGDGISDTIERNTIAGHAAAGIAIYNTNTNENRVSGNWIGLNASGTTPLKNTYGIALGYSSNGIGPSSNIIGTNSDGVGDSTERNIISGNTYGIILFGLGVNQNIITGNYIGTNTDGSAPIGNSYGVFVQSGASENRIGTNGDGVNDSIEGNLISGNSYGVIVSGSQTEKTMISGNIIGADSLVSKSIQNLYGIYVYNGASKTTIGSDEFITLNKRNASNVISGNFYGIYVVNSSTQNVWIASNYIGVARDGTTPIANQTAGIYIGSEATKVFVGGTSEDLGNIIAYSKTGVRANVPIANTKLYRSNRYYNNSSIAIDFGNDFHTPNDNGDKDGVTNYPIITSVIRSSDSLVIEGFSAPGSIIDFYSTQKYDDGFGQGNYFIASGVEGSLDDLDGSTGSYDSITLGGIPVGSETTNRFRFILPYSTLKKSVFPGEYITGIKAFSTSEFGNQSVVLSDFSLTNATTPENAGANAVVGTLAVTDPAAVNAFTYSLVTGTGDTNNAAFNISGNTLRATGSFDYENMSAYSVRIRATDPGGLFIEKAFTINVTNVNEAPTDLFLSSVSIPENSGGNTPIGYMTTVDDRHPTVVANFDNLPSLPAINSYSGLSSSNNGSSDYSGVTWDSRFQIVGRDYVELFVNQGSNTYLKPRSASFAAINANGDSGLTIQTTKILTGAWFARVDLGNGAYGATSITIHALNGTTILGSVTKSLNSTVASLVDTSQFLSLSGITGYRIDRVAQVGGIASRLGSWMADDFAFTDPSANAFTYSLVSGAGATDNTAFNITGNTLRATGSFDYENMSAYAVRIRATDPGGLFSEKAFTINVTNVNEAPTDLFLSSVSIPENSGGNTPIGSMTTVDDRHPTVVANFDNLPSLPAINSYSGLSSSNNGSSDYSGVTWDSRFQIVGRDYVELFVNQGANTYLKPRSASFAAINANGDSGLTIQTTKILTGAWFARVDLGNGAYGATSITIHALNGTTILGSVTKELNSTVPSFVDTTQFLNLTGITGYRIDRVAQVSGIASRLGSWMADDFAFTEPSANAFSYTLISGEGATDNVAFNITGNTLRANNSFDFENKSSYSIRIRSTDQGGLYTEKVFTINVTDVNETPTDISLSSSSITENAGANATVGTLSTTDPDALNTFTYSLVSGAGDTDNSAFNISGNTLRANNSFDFETKSSYSIRIRSTDQGGLYSEKAFTINVVNANELISVSVNGADSYINASQRSQVTSLVVVTESVLSDPQTAFSLTNIGLLTASSTNLASSQILVTNVGNVYTIRFGAGAGVVTRSGTGVRANSLADGNWILTVSNAQISGSNQFGNRAIDNFFRMFGDSDGDGDVDGVDSVALRRAQLAASYNAALDWDGNGSVSTGVDINNFSANVNKRRRSF